MMADDLVELRPIPAGVRKHKTLREALNDADDWDTVCYDKDDGDFWQVVPPQVYQ